MNDVSIDGNWERVLLPDDQGDQVAKSVRRNAAKKKRAPAERAFSLGKP
jgi:hypothetical protein